jgi:hypothetical protein
VVGTPYYMSPEQAHGEPLDGRSDIYSLGVTLYELAAGGAGPYQAERDNSDAVLREVRAGQIRPLRLLAPTIPPALERIITKAIAPDPAKRYQTAEELAADLDAFRSPGARVAVKQWPRLPDRQRALWIAGGVFAALVLIVAAYLYFNRNAGTRPEGNGPGGNGNLTKGADDYFHRERPVGVRVNLLRDDHVPFRHQRLLGEGAFTPLGAELVVQSPRGRPTLFALDNPRGQPVEFSVELRANGQRQTGVNDLGIFFGWQDRLADPQSRPRFFAARLDTRPVLKDIHGRLYLGTWMFEDAKGDRGGVFEQNLRPFHQGRGWIPLPKPPDKFDGWHAVRVRIEGQKFVVAIDKEPPREFDVNWITTADAWLQAYALEPRGALGIWVQNGIGSFRNATVKGLPAGN